MQYHSNMYIHSTNVPCNKLIQKQSNYNRRRLKVHWMPSLENWDWWVEDHVWSHHEYFCSCTMTCTCRCIYMIKINEPQLPWLRTAIYHTGLDVHLHVPVCACVCTCTALLLTAGFRCFCSGSRLLWLEPVCRLHRLFLP